jgi:hypothetical protein
MSDISTKGFAFTPSRSIETRLTARLRWNRDGKLEQLVTIITYHPRGAIDEAHDEWWLVPTQTE